MLDGTGNELGRNLSNVLKLYRIAQKSQQQLVYYSPGVGTISRISPWQRFRQKLVGVLGLAFGFGLDENVLGAYRFLVENYQNGDRIYLFGFSRGAWTARVLAGFIHLIGLLEPEQINMSDSALGTYKKAAKDNQLVSGTLLPRFSCRDLTGSGYQASKHCHIRFRTRRWHGSGMHWRLMNVAACSASQSGMIRKNSNQIHSTRA